MITSKPSYQEVISYYLRDDVLEYFWKLSQTRHLKFFHHCDIDPQDKSVRVKPQAIDVHCESSLESLKERVIDATSDVPKYHYDFFPFWGMQGTQINEPGMKEKIIGWDIRFEFDFDLKDSFAVLIPIAMMMETFDIPIIQKYSGHRSLHFIIPAEAFPIEMKKNVNRDEWLKAAEAIGHLCYRIAPYITTTQVKLSKELVITAPYSFHRYYGLLGIPLTVDQIFNFDPSIASLDKFSTVKWQFPDTWSDGKAMKRLLRLAEKGQEEIQVIQEIAEQSFKGDTWKNFLMKQLPEDIQNNSSLGLIMSGVGAINMLDKIPTDSRYRLLKAMLAVDNPLCKSNKFSALVHWPIDWHQPMSHYVEQRRVRSEVLSIWVESGLDASFEQLFSIAQNHKYTAPAVLATRICGILPEKEENVRDKLLELWEKTTEEDFDKMIFLSLCLGERVRNNEQIVQYLHRNTTSILSNQFCKHLLAADEWHAEENPDLAFKTLVIAFGEKKMLSWVKHPETDQAKIIIKSVFSNKLPKFIHTANRFTLE